MQNPPDQARTVTPLDDLGAIRVHGPDAVRFLQGQLSNDVTTLAADHPLLAGLHNPQGRVIALLRLVWLAADDILAILPRELAAPVVSRLGKFILRAKVKISDESACWRVTGVVGEPPAGLPFVLIDAASPRGWLVMPVDSTVRLADYSSLDRETWRALDIDAGLPQVYAATSEEFVAQMLNLDTLGAIAFDKGCYTGQEVIARAHYRGKVKRRMQRLTVATATPLAAGDAGQTLDGRSYKVVEAARPVAGTQTILAVIPDANVETI